MNDRDWTRLVRYVTGECPAEERPSTRRWINADPARRQALDELAAVHRARPASLPHWDVNAGWHAVARSAVEGSAVEVRAGRAEARPYSPPYDPRVREGRSVRAMGVRGTSALGIAGMLALGVVGVLVWGGGARWRGALGIPSLSMRTVVTTPGHLARLRLADGTSVVLGVASRLRYPREFGARARDVYLDGEAYFDVRHDAAHPFAVHAGNAVARDLGTRFVVRMYAGEPAVRVVVADGRVSLRDTAGRGGGPAVLAGGTLGQVDQAGVTTVTAGVDADRYVAWTRGELVFRNEPLARVLADLARWYDLEIELADQRLAERPVSGTVTDQSADAVLRGFASTVGVRVIRTGRVVVFAPAQPAGSRDGP